MTLILSDDDVASLLSMKECIAALEEAYKQLALGSAFNVPRRDSFMTTSRPDAYYSFKSIIGGLEGLGVVAERVNSDMITYPQIDGAHRRVKVPAAPGDRYVGLIFLYSSETLELLAIMNDGHLQRMRVAGTTGVGAKHLARADAKTATLLGTGWQAETAAWALAASRKLSKIKVYSPSREHRVAFARTVSEDLSLEVVPVDSPQEAVRGADIVATATNSHGAVFEGRSIKEGMHVTSIQQTETDEETWRRADLIVHSAPPDSYLSAGTDNESLKGIKSSADLHEIGEHRRQLYKEKGHTLGKLLAEGALGRADPSQITLFNKGGGLGIEFASVGKLVYDRALAQGVGNELPTEWFSQTTHP